MFNQNHVYPIKIFSKLVINVIKYQIKKVVSVQYDIFYITF